MLDGGMKNRLRHLHPSLYSMRYGQVLPWSHSRWSLSFLGGFFFWVYHFFVLMNLFLISYLILCKRLTACDSVRYGYLIQPVSSDRLHLSVKSLERKGRACFPYIFYLFCGEGRRREGCACSIHVKFCVSGTAVEGWCWTSSLKWNTTAVFVCMFFWYFTCPHLSFRKVLHMHKSFFMQNKSMQPTRDKDKIKRSWGGGGIRFWIVSTITMFLKYFQFLS